MSSAPNAVTSVAIIGGGSAGWMTAAALANDLGDSCKITLIESEAIGTVGVGEATIPPIKHFNRRLGIDEATFVKETSGSFKLGIEFINWARKGHAYFHPFGTYGVEFDTVPFYQHWMREHLAGDDTPIDDYSMAWVAARDGKFSPPSPDRRNVLSTLDYAYHFDAALYANYLRRYAEQRGTTRIEGRVVDAAQDSESGFLTSVTLEDGQSVAADLFIDCSGFIGLLIEKKLATGYQDWSHWLPCNRAVAVTCEKNGPVLAHTQSTAKDAGWQWRIPLQHRTGKGYVYCSDYLEADDAEKELLSSLDGAPLRDPKHLRFVTGRRNKFWNKNCVAIGLAAGFMEPLESTSLHLIQYGIMRLLALFPDKTMSPLLAEEYNSLTIAEYERVRDFLILHYTATEREDTAFWRYCKSMPIPDRLAYKIEHFKTHGMIVSDERELFHNASWIAVYLGQDIVPAQAPALARHRTHVPTQDRLKAIRHAMNEAVGAMATHDDFIGRHCASALQ